MSVHWILLLIQIIPSGLRSAGIHFWLYQVDVYCLAYCGNAHPQHDDAYVVKRVAIAVVY